jgi:hypothetical protein
LLKRNVKKFIKKNSKKKLIKIKKMIQKNLCSMNLKLIEHQSYHNNNLIDFLKIIYLFKNKNLIYKNSNFVKIIFFY